MIRYDIKIYWVDGIYKTTINPNIIMQDISFTENVNWWQGELRLDLALDFWDTSISNWDFIKVVLYNERYKQGKQIYYWYVSQITRKYDTNKGYIQLTCLWISSLLNKIIFQGTYNDTVKNILTTIINQFNAKYNNIITIGQIDDYSETINVEFWASWTCQNAIKKIQEITNYYWFVNSEGVFSFREKLTQTNHIIANSQQIETISLNYNIESLVNKLYVERQDWTIKTYEDLTSQGLYWIKEKYTGETNIVDNATQDEFGNSYLKQYWDPKNQSSIVINSEYDIESIIPWDTITIVNLDFEIKNLLVEKISYTPIRITLTLEELETLWDVISN